MPDRYAFNHLGDERICIECSEGGKVWKWTEEKRREHFFICSGANIKSSIDFQEALNNSGGLRVTKCRICGEEFSQPIRRGRPRKNCYVCKPEE